MAQKVLKVGVVGCGEIAQVAHLPLLQELPYFEVTALCDISEKVLNYLGHTYKVTDLYTDYKELIANADVDIVLVANKDHAPITIAALKAGKHVFTEKPMCFNLEEAEEIIKAEKANNVKLLVGTMKRYDPAFQYVLPLIKELDDVHLVKVHDFGGDYSINPDIYDEVKNTDLSDAVQAQLLATEKEKMVKAIGKDREDLVEAYSALMYNLIHDEILLHDAFGMPTSIEYVDVYNDTTVLAVLKYGDNIRCVFEGGLLLERRDWDEVFQVYADSKNISVEFPFPYIKNAMSLVKINEQDELDPKANVSKTVYVSYDEAFKKEWRHFYECVTEDKTPFNTSDKARNCIALNIDLIKSVKKA
jgi:predicted dehydrogenase